MVKKDQNRQKWSKSPKIVKNGPKWPKMVKMVQNRPKWSKIVQNGPKWSKMVQNGSKWSKTIPNKFKYLYFLFLCFSEFAVSKLGSKVRKNRGKEILGTCIVIGNMFGAHLSSQGSARAPEPRCKDDLKVAVAPGF